MLLSNACPSRTKRTKLTKLKSLNEDVEFLEECSHGGAPIAGHQRPKAASRIAANHPRLINQGQMEQMDQTEIPFVP
jgi:hypothetical protein